MPNKNLHISYSPDALQDLDELWEYIAYQFSNVNSADAYIDGIMALVSKAAGFPGMGTSLLFAGTIPTEYRYLVYKKYLIFYRTDSTTLYVDRVIYGRRDYMKLLFPKE